MICSHCHAPLICAACSGARGGKARVKKGFAVKPLSAAARRRAWETRKKVVNKHAIP